MRNARLRPTGSDHRRFLYLTIVAEIHIYPDDLSLSPRRSMTASIVSYVELAVRNVRPDATGSKPEPVSRRTLPDPGTRNGGWGVLPVEDSRTCNCSRQSKAMPNTVVNPLRKGSIFPTEEILLEVPIRPEEDPTRVIQPSGENRDARERVDDPCVLLEGSSSLEEVLSAADAPDAKSAAITSVKINTRTCLVRLTFFLLS